MRSDRNPGRQSVGVQLPRGFLHVYGAILRICDVLVGLVLAMEMTLISINVTGRYFFNHSWGWIDEICQYSLLWLVTLGSVSLMDRYGLFYAEVLLLFIKKAAVRRAIFAGNCLLLIFFFAVVFWFGIEYVRITWSFELDYSEVRKYWFYTSLPIWGALMLLVVVKKLLTMEEPAVTEVESEM